MSKVEMTLEEYEALRERAEKANKQYREQLEETNYYKNLYNTIQGGLPTFLINRIESRHVVGGTVSCSYDNDPSSNTYEVRISYRVKK